MEGGTDFDLEVLEGDAGVQAAAAEAKQAQTAAAAETRAKTRAGERVSFLVIIASTWS